MDTTLILAITSTAIPVVSILIQIVYLCIVSDDLRTGYRTNCFYNFILVPLGYFIWILNFIAGFIILLYTSISYAHELGEQVIDGLLVVGWFLYIVNTMCVFNYIFNTPS